MRLKEEKKTQKSKIMWDFLFKGKILSILLIIIIYIKKLNGDLNGNNKCKLSHFMHILLLIIIC